MSPWFNLPGQIIASLALIGIGAIAAGLMYAAVHFVPSPKQ